MSKTALEPLRKEVFLMGPIIGTIVVEIIKALLDGEDD